MSKIFTISEWVVLEEYLRHSPQKIKEVRYSSKTKSKVLELNFQHTVSLREVKFEGNKDFEFDIMFDVYDWKSSLKSKNFREENKRVLILDQIHDPRNFGAIVRSAAFFGFSAVFFASSRQSPITPLVLETARGGFCLVKAFEVPNIKLIMEELKEKEYWVYAADMNGEDCRKISKRHTLDENLALVLGNEGEGIRDSVIKKCDGIISIKPVFAQSLESLNVSVAAGILMHSFFDLHQA